MFNHFNWIHSLWHSKRKSIEISPPHNSSKSEAKIKPNKCQINSLIEKSKTQVLAEIAASSQQQADRSSRSLATCPILLYASLALLLCLLQLQVEANSSARPEQARLAPLSSSASNSRQRWINLNNQPSSSIIRDHRLRPTRRIYSQLNQALNRITNRIGARNTIRVHNAFRDLAWRILSSLSMPTPVIYDLRRQNFYSAEDDHLNDLLYNKNTTRSVRTRRLLRLGRHLVGSSSEQRADYSDDEQQDEDSTTADDEDRRQK